MTTDANAFWRPSSELFELTKTSNASERDMLSVEIAANTRDAAADIADALEALDLRAGLALAALNRIADALEAQNVPEYAQPEDDPEARPDFDVYPERGA